MMSTRQRIWQPVVLVLLFTVMCVLAGWSNPEGAAAKDPAVRILKFQTLYSEGKHMYESVKFFTSEIEKRTQGRIRFQIFPGSSLVPTKQMLSSVHKGILDSAFVPAAYEQGLWPITGITMTFGAPNITYEKWRTIHDQVRDIMNKNIDINVVIVGMPHVVTYLYHSKKPLSGKIDDFKNALVRSAGGAYDASFKALGCAPVRIPAPEAYMALQKGTIDSAWSGYGRFVESKLYEVTPYVMIIPKGMVISAQHFIVNKHVWNSLPADIQRIFLEVGTEVVGVTNDRCAALDKKVVTETLPKLGITPIIMDKAENEVLLKKLAVVWPPLVAKLGKPAEEIAEILGVK
ncbi:MAG: hypothetical protein DRG83_03765 [Deltaproteobacteria bacterium]|nr:MAG: hypothetical protein DRG83_03765 [Deltaproteobacteria bacterium]